MIIEYIRKCVFDNILMFTFSHIKKRKKCTLPKDNAVNAEHVVDIADNEDSTDSDSPDNADNTDISDKKDIFYKIQPLIRTVSHNFLFSFRRI